MKYVGGVDVGSTQTKAVIIDENCKVVGRALLDMETSMVTVAEDAFTAALADAGIERATWCASPAPATAATTSPSATSR